MDIDKFIAESFKLSKLLTVHTFYFFPINKQDTVSYGEYLYTKAILPNKSTVTSAYCVQQWAAIPPNIPWHC